MQNTTEKSSRSAEGLYKFFIYFVLVLLAVTIIVPVAWVFMASIKQNAEFYGNPWALPAGFYWQNFVNAWNGAKMGEYMLNSVIVTALALVLLLAAPLLRPIRNLLPSMGGIDFSPMVLVLLLYVINMGVAEVLQATGNVLLPGLWMAL